MLARGLSQLGRGENEAHVVLCPTLVFISTFVSAQALRVTVRAVMSGAQLGLCQGQAGCTRLASAQGNAQVVETESPTLLATFLAQVTFLVHVSACHCIVALS